MNAVLRDELDRDRKELLERCAAVYAREAFAIVWTDGLEGDAAKRVTRRGWPQTKPLAGADGGAFAAALFATRGQTRNPALVVRASRLITVECDTPAGLVQVEELGLPPTWTVRSSEAHRQHRHFRWPGSVEPEKVSFRFEADGVTADSEHYYLVPPALNPSGAVYAFLPGLSPDDLPIAELPEPSFRGLLRLAGVNDRGPVSPTPSIAPPPPTPPDPEHLRRERLERLLAACSDEDAEGIAADPLGGGHSPHAYGLRVLANACERVASTSPGSRHSALNKSAFVVGGYLAATGLDRDRVIAALEAAAEAAGLESPADRAQSSRTIERGLTAGAARPRAIPERAA